MQIGLRHAGARGDGRGGRAAKSVFGEDGLRRLEDRPFIFRADRDFDERLVHKDIPLGLERARRAPFVSRLGNRPKRVRQKRSVVLPDERRQALFRARKPLIAAP